MASWAELLGVLDQLPDDAARTNWVLQQQIESLKMVARLRSGRRVIVYASGFLQKPQAPAQLLQISHEDLNGFMGAVYGVDCSPGLTLVLHTPGGNANATEAIVSYLRSKFPRLEVIIPTYAMSAGTMISLAADCIVMGRQSQLGPIDPQFIIRQSAFSARAIVDQFHEAKNDILADTRTAHAWAPILQSLGPAYLQEAENALKYGEEMVARWLARYMFSQEPNAAALAAHAARHFNDASTHKSHGRRIDREEARSLRLSVEDLETSQSLQNAVLTLYHLLTISFEKGPATKIIMNDDGTMWVKNWGQVAVPSASPPQVRP